MQISKDFIIKVIELCISIIISGVIIKNQGIRDLEGESFKRIWIKAYKSIEIDGKFENGPVQKPWIITRNKKVSHSDEVSI